MTNIFYVGLNPRFQNFSWLPRGINVMLSAGGYWDRTDWRQSARFPKQTGSRWLDSGGFTLLNKFGDYPFSLMQYIGFIGWLRPHWFASMDYPCEPEISRRLSLMTNSERINKTVENTARLAELEPMTWPARMVPVIQGYGLDEYLSCIEQYRKQGLIRDYMAVGSMCRRISSAELHKIIPAIYEASTQAGAKRLHYFGLKLSKDLIDLSPFIYSRDSAVGMDAYDPALRRERNGRRFPRGPEEKRKSFMSFLDRLDQMGLCFRMTERCRMAQVEKVD